MKEEPRNITLLSVRDEPTVQKIISSPLASLQLASLPSAMGRRGLQILAIMRRHGPKIEGPTLSSYPNNDRAVLRDLLSGDGSSWEGKLGIAIQIRGWIILSVMLFLWGCATTHDVRILDGEIYKLQSQLNLIQKEKDSSKN
jgi:hypothetical protein